MLDKRKKDNCEQCKQLKLKLKAANEELGSAQEQFLDNKQKFAEQTNNALLRCNAIELEKQQIQIKLEMTMREKRFILRKLTDYMMAYDLVDDPQVSQKNTQASKSQQPINVFKPRPVLMSMKEHPQKIE